jgi:c-di-GMP-binding flagellar brake protein YcgR
MQPHGLVAGSAADDERFQVYSRLEIVSILRSLATKRELVSVHFGETDAMLTLLLDVSPERDEVLLDCCPDPALNARLLAARRLTCVSRLAHIPIRFAAEGASATYFQGEPAFAVQLPPTVARIQRREFFRVRVPLTQAVRCEIPAPHNGVPAAVLATARVLDMSGGGLSLADLPPTVSWEPGTIHEACRLPLPNVGTLVMDLEVVRLSHGPVAPSQRGPHAGVHFVNLNDGNRTRLQRFINDLQRMELARSDLI